MRLSADLERAKRLLSSGGYSCALVRGEVEYSSALKGVSPMLQFLSSGADLRGFSAADKIVGRAAAMLFILAGAKEVYADVMGAQAVDLLAAHGIEASCGELVEEVLNREGTGPCPMEEAVRGIDEPIRALAALVSALERLRARRREAGMVASLAFRSSLNKDQGVERSF